MHNAMSGRVACCHWFSHSRMNNANWFIELSALLLYTRWALLFFLYFSVPKCAVWLSVVRQIREYTHKEWRVIAHTYNIGRFRPEQRIHIRYQLFIIISLLSFYQIKLPLCLLLSAYPCAFSSCVFETVERQQSYSVNKICHVEKDTCKTPSAQYN